MKPTTLFLPLLASLALVACGGDDDDEPTATVAPASTVATVAGETPQPTEPAAAATADDANPIDLDKDKDDAFEALQRQMKFLTDGQSSRAYEEIHPAQRALFTKEEYGACVRDLASLGDVKLELEEAYLEPDTLIPGTTTRTDVLALTVKMTVNGSTDTNTFREMKVDGEWFFAVADPAERC